MPVDVEIGFMEEDPKSTLAYQIKENFVLFKDEGETSATAYVAYNKPPETVRQLLIKYDVIITIGDPESDNVKTLENTKFHNAIYPVRVYCIDKPGITAKRMIWDLVTLIWLIIINTASDPGGAVKHWKVVEGQIAEDIDMFKPSILRRRIRIQMLYVEGLPAE